jgi:hypothetical protein
MGRIHEEIVEIRETLDICFKTNLYKIIDFEGIENIICPIK